MASESMRHRLATSRHATAYRTQLSTDNVCALLTWCTVPLHRRTGTSQSAGKLPAHLCVQPSAPCRWAGHLCTPAQTPWPECRACSETQKLQQHHLFATAWLGILERMHLKSTKAAALSTHARA